MTIELTKSEIQRLVRIGVANPNDEIVIQNPDGTYSYYKPADPIKKEDIGKKMKYQIVYLYPTYHAFARIYKPKKTEFNFRRLQKELKKIFK